MTAAVNRVRWFLVLGLGVLSSCAAGQRESKTATEPPPMRSVAPGAEDAKREYADPSDDDADTVVDIDALERELQERETSLRSLGIVVDTKLDATPATDDAGDAPDRCERICKLSTSICGLRDRICGLAETHPDEPRYQNVCARAERDCERASKACSDCT